MHLLVNHFPIRMGLAVNPVVNGDKTFLTNEKTSVDQKYDEALICPMLDFLTDNIYINLVQCGGGGIMAPYRFFSTQLVAMATLLLRGICGSFRENYKKKIANFNMISPSNPQYRFRFGIST